MPYIAIKGYPKDAETKKKVVEKINRVLLENWGCPQEAISISVEEVEPEKWNETVVEKEIGPKADKMYILNGERKF
ncbi:MAG: tautomerase family protein [Thermoguttaceae bacterium]|nr:tautomerase family protein [Thermoguttaceae bacterium]